MNKLIYDLIDSIIQELNQPEIKDKINAELLQPIIQHITKQLYPYLITTCVIIVLMFICIIAIFIMMLQPIFKKEHMFD